MGTPMKTYRHDHVMTGPGAYEACRKCGAPHEVGREPDYFGCPYESAEEASRISAIFHMSPRGREIIKAELQARKTSNENPKTRYGEAKAPLGLVPGSALVHASMAQKSGDEKYGRANWRVSPVTASTYYHALLRHLYLWIDGQDYDTASEAHHLGHVISNAAILLDAMESGTLIDDRPTKGSVEQALQRTTKELKDGDQ